MRDETGLLAKQTYRDAMSHLGAAVNVITTDGPGGRAGFTASAVCSVTDTPPTLLVCINRTASVYPAVIANQVLCVNTLAAGQEALSLCFSSKMPMQERFHGSDWRRLETGAPVLAGAIVAFDCRIKSTSSVGSHDVLFCEVLATSHNDEMHQGLMYFHRQYYRLGPG
jgi:flavin reductase